MQTGMEMDGWRDVCLGYPVRRNYSTCPAVVVIGTTADKGGIQVEPERKIATDMDT